jgi:hypothetical protein
MTSTSAPRRAVLLGFAFVVAGCDVVQFVNDPRPTFEQTWNIPTAPTAISAGSLLPANVSIYSTPGVTPPDSSAFLLTLSNVVFAKRVGDDCAQCQSQNGTTATKPAFVLAAGGSSPLPTNVVSGALLGANVSYSIVNNLSFDPIRVRPVSDPIQGYMLVLVRSGSVVLGRDSINGATTAFPPGATLAAPVTMNTGTVTGVIQVEVTISSPAGDPAQPPVVINANGTLNVTATLANVRTSSLRINVVNKQITNKPDTIDLKGLDEAITRRIESGRLEMSIDNPWSVAGNLGLNLVYDPPASLPKTIALPAATQPQTSQQQAVLFDKTDMQTLLGNEVILNMAGPVSSATPVTVTPKQAIGIANRMVLVLRTGGGQ